ncbi:glycoside hydrolase family 15 protein [Burkholderia ubonensis]|uniref:Glucoamylase n=1 Tax=Burkholderia ubonensis subsp. mesacidophila TaxID=265293 RepID=A0A2A4FP12_9BURK|nr:glycoside hydrolase family 15 protein [Burkholderia ubonensis]PCE34412.1 glucoamylase [Burkholderia ubonensis subsp. mesacidophila]
MNSKHPAAASPAALAGTSSAQAQGVAPGAPGATGTWNPANKHGFGTSTTIESKVWFTLGSAGLDEIYYPRLDTPSVRGLQFVVSDGTTFAARVADHATHETTLTEADGLAYRQVDVDHAGRFRLTKTYATDPARPVVLVDVTFESLDGQPYQVYALLNPAPGNALMNTTGETNGATLTARNGNVATAFASNPPFTRVSNGYAGASDGWQDIGRHFRMTRTYACAPQGNVVQTGQTPLDGVTRTHVTLAIGFGDDAAQATRDAQCTLADGFASTARRYAEGWHRYLRTLKPAPASAAAHLRLYNAAVMILAAHEDKTWRGAFAASPSMPWAFGTALDQPSGPYHLVWARDLYQIATALIAAGDRSAAERALDWLLATQQKADGAFPQNSQVDGTPYWGGLQMDEVSFPIVLAWQLRRFDRPTYVNHIRKAADFIVATGPYTPAERWENQGGYSPAAIAAQIAGLVAAADIARRNGDAASAAAYAATADDWQRNVESWTATRTGPYSRAPYYLRLTKDRQPDAATPYHIGDSGPDDIDQRAVVDPSFLDLVRLGVKPADDPVILNSLAVVDAHLGVTTPNGMFWHRYTFDGYGEQRDGSAWRMGLPAGSQMTIGRAWPIFAGERGEYELAANQPDLARTRLDAMAASTNDGLMLPEQVWDRHAPSGLPGFAAGTGTTSATPLAWTEAQFVRLAWSIDCGAPVALPSIVASRYAGPCNGDGDD